MGEDRTLNVIVGSLIAFIIGATVYMAVAMSDWEDDCIDAGGTVVSEYIGQSNIPVFDGQGRMTGMVSTPNYSYTCVDARGAVIELDDQP